MIFEVIEFVALGCGISLFETNSKEAIETQLNRLTRKSEAPIMLVSWDVSGTVEFNSDGILTNPMFSVSCLLLTKPNDRAKEKAESSSKDMQVLILKFLRKLNDLQRPKMVSVGNAVTSIKISFVPMYGIGKHSGVLCTFDVKDDVKSECE